MKSPEIVGAFAFWGSGCLARARGAAVSFRHGHDSEDGWHEPGNLSPPRRSSVCLDGSDACRDGRRRPCDGEGGSATSCARHANRYPRRSFRCRAADRSAESGPDRGACANSAACTVAAGQSTNAVDRRSLYSRPNRFGAAPIRQMRRVRIRRCAARCRTWHRRPGPMSRPGMAGLLASIPPACRADSE